MLVGISLFAATMLVQALVTKDETRCTDLPVDGYVDQAYPVTRQNLDRLPAGYTVCATESGNLLAYLPLITKPLPTPTPLPTPILPTPSSPVGDVNIIYIFYDGGGSQEPDEYVEIQNVDANNVQLGGWTLRDNANHVFVFPNFVMMPGQVCRIYTNQYHPEWCGFSYNNSAAIWNNSGDCAVLQNGSGIEIDKRCY